MKINKEKDLYPKHLKGRNDCWWYVNKGSIDVVVECRDKSGNYIETKIINIKKNSILKAFGIRK